MVSYGCPLSFCVAVVESGKLDKSVCSVDPDFTVQCIETCVRDRLSQDEDYKKHILMLKTGLTQNLPLLHQVFEWKLDPFSVAGMSAYVSLVSFPFLFFSFAGMHGEPNMILFVCELVLSMLEFNFPGCCNFCYYFFHFPLLCSQDLKTPEEKARHQQKKANAAEARQTSIVGRCKTTSVCCQS